ncbi:helix-turn-helix domain-containing protein [Alcanivorax sp.]|uniref:MerR family transcriptional regulator n=1 Tax=Alcanivorax sp. TaxID=1872427 RepID=UPI000C4B6529|nr:helix-turn-helix domain-containing protein [Alcanivorax sp.]MBQ26372.1 MerR family transcriptional regulator [Alcanivorax sp.]|tara:strand:- start:411 stop:827 length:417 start_codon:yes stop_codon:yes gene_type:complete
MSTLFSIGTLSDATGCKVETIRYYEKIGLMPEPARSEGGQRRYHRNHQERLQFIRHSRELGFTLEDIRELLAMSEQHGCADDIARRHRDAVQNRISALTALRNELDRMISECEQGQPGECRVIEVLSDHGQCLTDHGG